LGSRTAASDETALMAFRSLVALAALVFVGQTPAPIQADAVFAQAIAAVENDAVAPYATYTVVVTVTDDGHRVVDSWTTTEDIAHAIVMASSFSDTERANPTAPRGINVAARRRFPVAAVGTLIPNLDATTRWTNSHPVNSERADDVVGPVALAVDQNFGLTPPRAYRVANDELAMAGAAGDLTVIGRTGKTVPRYRAALLDADAGIAHLELTPLRDPYHNRLRELWVDTQTAHVREAIVQGIGDRAPFDRVRWRVTFDRLEGATYLKSANLAEPLHIGRSTPQISIAFENVVLLAYSPIKTTFGIGAPVRYLRDP
jgi:hypothetical protein